MRKLALAPVLFLCLAATPSLALSDKPYITAADVDFSMMLPAPPKEDTAAGKRDIQAIVDLQKNMTPELDAAIHKDLDQSVYTVAGPVLGPKFTKENFPMAGEFFAKVVKDAGVGVGPIKQKYKKLRPFQYSKEIKTPDDIAKAAGGPTYPSGHSTTAGEVALLMGMMVPEKRDALYERSDEYATHRITSGAAYPSDRMGGYITASLAINQMMKNPEFRADYEAVKTEVRKGLGLN
ncbi:MAG TPA: phosphatase PAP2 family protein [Micropepsaceae bacterium]|nr:phosphatase PAP2 family protein [Micropepsaceae bacterium]